MFARWALSLVVFAVALAAGCGPNCNQASVCAVIGTGADIRVCDGGDYRDCGNGNRGQTVSCSQRAEVAICTTTGWTFVPTGNGP